MAKRKRNKITNIIEYIPLRIAIFLVDIIPLRVSLAMSKAVGLLVWWLLPNRRRLAVNNILLAGITEDKKEAKRIESIYYRSIDNKPFNYRKLAGDQ